MAHFCGFIKLIFLLLMLARMLANGETKPLKSGTVAASDLIAGNEFLKLFMGQEELEREYYSRHPVDAVGSSVTADFKDSDEFDKKSAETGRTRLVGSRSLKIQGPRGNQAEGQSEDSKQVAKVNSGSKIVFLEDYDENDAILDAEAREIDLKKENYKAKDDYKVVSVSVSSSSSSSSSQRGTTPAKNRLTATTSKYDNKSYTSTKSVVTVTPRPPTATTNKPSSPSPSKYSTAKPKTATSAPAAAAATGDNFINRSHKSEFSVEEVQPSDAKHHRHHHQHQQRKPQQQQQQHKSRKQYTRHRTYPITSVADTLEALDSANSASTSIQNVLASPLQPAASLRSTSTVTTTYHSGQRNVSINHDTSSLHKLTGDLAKDMTDQSHQQQPATGVDDQLLPFQTVIYHDTKDGHGPQSRSISYSSISQNVEDLKKWHQSGILAEARRNVSESLKPLPPAHQSEPSKFYSQPAKMYSEPSKFYSEPAKVYSEPSKIYGEPEKFYSEPAKVYGQPSKFYGEPAKVYSQPAKVYGEPAKTYWPVTLTTSSPTTTTTTSRPLTLAPTTHAPHMTTIPVPHIYSASRKPAIVSRIAFGEAQVTASSSTSTSPPTTTTTARPLFGSYQRTYGHRQPPSAAAAAAASSSFSSGSAAMSENTSSAAPSRRILFNLDRLPYDLLNAPQPATRQQLLELQKPTPQQQTLTYQQQPQQQQSPPHHHNINPCLESAVSSLFSSSTLSAHPALIKQRQQHSSLSDQQHSNQNAKGLPNGDLVRCVAEISHAATASSGDGADDAGVQFTTERSNIEELFTPTPEQSYEIEESVSVMTNGRAHGRNSLTLPTTATPPPAPQPFKPNRQRVHFGTNINAADAVSGSGGGVGGGVGHLSQSFNTNANANGDANSNSHPQHRNLHSDGNTSPDYNSYDDAGDNDDDNDNDNNNNNDDYGDADDTDRHRGSAAANGNDSDDSKVAYVVEGRNYRKYRVEEKTDDGFIVGEYGVVDHNDGNLRGVRYTADSTINRSLIQKALLTFLKLK